MRGLSLAPDAARYSPITVSGSAAAQRLLSPLLRSDMGSGSHG